MKPFLAQVLELKKVYDLPGSWQDEDYRALLQRLEVEGMDDLSSGDLLDVTLMALQDLEPEAAADAVLAYKLPHGITPGSRRNLIEDLLEGQREWEDFADIGLHASIFAATELLQRAFPRNFPRPDLMRLVLRLQPRTAEAEKILQDGLQPAFVTRLLADAMDEHSILERLFEDQLRSHRFPEAEGIVWLAICEQEAGSDGKSVRLSVYSSKPWLEDMETIDEFESAAYNDREFDDEED